MNNRIIPEVDKRDLDLSIEDNWLELFKDLVESRSFNAQKEIRVRVKVDDYISTLMASFRVCADPTFLAVGEYKMYFDCGGF